MTPNLLTRLFGKTPYFPIGENHFRFSCPQHLPIPQLKQILRKFNKEFKKPQFISLWNASFFSDLHEAPPPPPPPAPKKGHFFVEGVSLFTNEATIRSILAAIGIPHTSARWAYSVNGSEAISFAMEPHLLKLAPNIPHEVDGARFSLSDNGQKFELDGGPLVLADEAQNHGMDLVGLAAALSKRTPPPQRNLDRSFQQPLASAHAKIQDVIRFNARRKSSAVTPTSLPQTTTPNRQLEQPSVSSCSTAVREGVPTEAFPLPNSESEEQGSEEEKWLKPSRASRRQRSPPTTDEDPSPALGDRRYFELFRERRLENASRGTSKKSARIRRSDSQTTSPTPIPSQQ